MDKKAIISVTTEYAKEYIRNQEENALIVWEITPWSTYDGGTTSTSKLLDLHVERWFAMQNGTPVPEAPKRIYFVTYNKPGDDWRIMADIRDVQEWFPETECVLVREIW